MAIQRTVGLLGLPYELYAFSSGVCDLLRLALDAMESQELAARGSVSDATAGDGSVGTTPTSWWSPTLSGTMGAASDCNAS